MKKLAIASIVGGIILFVWQTLSWAILNLHGASQRYTPKQDTVMAFLNTQFTEDGAYLMPNYPPGMSHDEMEKSMSANDGKPWAQIQYHKALNVNMGSNMLRGLLTDIIIVGLLCFVLVRLKDPDFSRILIVTIGTGVIVFLNSPYTIHIWYPKADITMHLVDGIVSFGLCGLWLGWYLNRGKTA